MARSAHLGQTPVSFDDQLIYKALRGEQAREGVEHLAKISTDSHESRSAGMVIGQSFAIGIVIIFTCARLWVRKFRLRAFGADDAVMIPAALACVAYFALDIASETAGCIESTFMITRTRNTHSGSRSVLSDHFCQGLGPTDDEIKFAHIQFVLWNFTVFAVKISIVLQNRRLTGITSKN